MAAERPSLAAEDDVRLKRLRKAPQAPQASCGTPVACASREAEKGRRMTPTGIGHSAAPPPRSAGPVETQP